MKLFKKLAAVALAAVLALSMVGCGKTNSVNSTKQLVLDLIADNADWYGGECNNTAAMDGIAQNLLNKAAELYRSEEQTDKSAGALLKAASKAEGMGFDATKAYLVNWAEDYQYNSSIFSNADKQEIFFMHLTQNYFIVSQGGTFNTKKADVGVAVGKIGDKTYVVMVTMPTETAAAPGTTTKD